MFRMDEFKPQENADVVSSVNGLIHGGNKVTRLDCRRNDMESARSLCDVLKCCLLKFAMDGIDKAFIDRKRWKKSPLVNNHHSQVFLGDNGIVDQECGGSEFSQVSEKAQKSMRRTAFRSGCAFFWSSYVFLMLSGLLASGFAFSSLVMRNIVEKPPQTRQLNFDYTKSSPVAYVPIVPQSDLGPVIPRDHKLQLTVSLTMPESEYNRQLGIFQVKVELVTATGKVRTSSSQPCMLQFKSNPTRVVETIIKSVPVIAGFGSESQVLNIKMKELTQGLEPTAFLKEIIESRAEYKSGAGISAIYEASLSLESDIPQLKRIIWNWRRTIFVWTSTLIFLTELIFVSLFFTPIIVPRGRRLLAYAKKETHSTTICCSAN